MAKKTQSKEPLVVPGRIVMPYENFVGTFTSKFLTELRDNKRLFGVRCPKCNRVYMPPRANCFQCFSKLDQWVELGTAGTVVSYTTVHYALPVHPVKAPFTYALIKLDGADTPFVHLLGEVEPAKMKEGLRVQAVFKDERVGDILDIKYFKPL